MVSSDTQKAPARKGPREDAAAHLESQIDEQKNIPHGHEPHARSSEASAQKNGLQNPLTVSALR
jgi:hypothetical protein